MAEKIGVYLVAGGAPASRQLIQQIRMLVAIGAWREGERIPSSEELAAHLGVNNNTVRGAYSRLVRAGTLIGEVPHGTTVALGARSSALLMEVVREHLSAAIGLVWSLGTPRELLEDTLREVIAERYEGLKDKDEVDNG